MLKDNIDEESEGNDYVLDEEADEGVDQDSTDESDDDAGEADDNTPNGMYLFWLTTYIYLIKNLYRQEQMFSNGWLTIEKLNVFVYEYGGICFFLILISLFHTIIYSVLLNNLD